MSGTAIFLWHDGKPRYDEVIWDPRPVTPDQAVRIAGAKMIQDRRATRIQVAYSECEFYEVVRPPESRPIGPLTQVSRATADTA